MSRKRSVVKALACAAVLVVAGVSGCGGDDEHTVPRPGGTGGGGRDGSVGSGGSSSGGTAGGGRGGSGGASGRGGTGGSNGRGGTGGTGTGGTSGTGTGGTSGTGTGGTSATGGTSGQDAGADAADAADDAIADAATDSATCTIGEVSSEATASNLSLFGTPVYFNGGDPLPAGTYRITYVDGCMKYGGGQGWTVNAYAAGCCEWWLIGESTADKKLVPPGTIGYAVGSGAYANFTDCEAESRNSPAQEFAHTGGRLGVWLQDSPYTDNLAGENGRNPRWRLVRLGACVDGGVPDASID